MRGGGRIYEVAAAIRPDPIVLYFHHVARTRREHYTSMSLDLFRTLLEAITEIGTIVDIAQSPTASSGNDENGPLFALTFDDGYMDSVDIVADVLLQDSVPGTFFVPTDRIGGRVHAPWGGQAQIMDTDVIADLARRGFSIASHGASHSSLDLMDPADARSDLSTARKCLDLIRGTGVHTDIVAYPYGNPPAVVPPWIRLGFATIREPARPWSMAPHRVRRVYIDPTLEPAVQKAIVQRWVELWE